MSPDNDLLCVPAPAPVAPPESSVKTMMIDRNDIGGSKTPLVVGGLLLVLVLLTGVVVAFKKYSSGDAAASVSSEAVTGDEGSSDDVANATDTDAPPAECVGEIADPQLRWYCQEFLPFARKASADHGRIDRLEAMDRNTGGSGVPLSLWLVVIGIGLLTTVNMVLIFKRASPKNEPPPGP